MSNNWIKLTPGIRVQFLHKTLKAPVGVVKGNHLYYDSQLDWISKRFDSYWSFTSSKKQNVILLFNDRDKTFYITEHTSEDEAIKTMIRIELAEDFKIVPGIKYKGRYVTRVKDFATRMRVEWIRN